MKYRKKPVEIEAFKLGLGHATQPVGMPHWWQDALTSGSVTPSRAGSVLVNTLEGTMRAAPGDWIIKGLKGELYPCKDEIFQASYEPAP